MSRSSHTFQVDHSNNIGREVQIISQHNPRKILYNFFTLPQPEKFRCCRNREVCQAQTLMKNRYYVLVIVHSVTSYVML